MKKTTTLLLLAVAITLGSCRKTGCWKCTTRQVNESGVKFSGAAARFTECDKNEVEIRKLEKERSGTQATTINGKTTTSTVVTTCK